MTNETNNMKPTLIITAGLPGAGKSTTISKSEFASLPVVDPDKEKEGMKGYDPKNISLEIHKESKRIARRKHLSFLANGESFIVDGTGTNVEKYIQYINEAKELGYEVILFYVEVSTKTSIERNAKRSRTVPVEIILEKSSIIGQSTKMIGSICDKFITVNND
jgi:predicted kinase